MVVPAAQYFSSPELRKGRASANVVVYGPAHLFRSAWLAGASDYLKDPWSAEELYLRLRGPAPSVVEWSAQGAALRLDGRTLSSAGRAVHLSAVEAEVLRTLVHRRGSAVSRPVLAWAASCSEGRVIDTLVGRIRLKLAAVGVSEGPLSVRGLGYRLP